MRGRRPEEGPLPAEAWAREDQALLSGGLAMTAANRMRAEGLEQHPAHAALARAGFRAAARSVAVEALAAPALSRLNEAGIKFVVIKGPAVARFYPTRAERPYSDLDVLVATRDFDRARHRLRSEGFGTAEPEQPYDWFHTLCMEGMNLHHASGANLDLHHHVPPWVFGEQVSFEGVFARSEPGRVADVPVRLASLEDGLAVASLHVVNDLWKYQPSLVPWRDIVVLAERLGTRRARQALADRGLEWLLPLVDAELGIGLSSCGPSGSEARGLRSRLLTMRVLESGWQRPTLASRHRLGWGLRLPAARCVAFLAGSAMPSRSFVVDHGGTRLNYLRDSVRYFRRLVGNDPGDPADRNQPAGSR